MKKLCWIAGITLLLSACLKKSDETIPPSIVKPFTGKDIISSLKAESSVQLFYHAVDRLGLAGNIDSSKGYTMLAPTDSAMKAAGLDAAGIDAMNLDTLRKIIAYHIVLGSLDENALISSVVSSSAPTMSQTVIVNPQGSNIRQYLPIYLQKRDVLYINGTAVPQSMPAIQASNGYIYVIPWVINNKPEKDLYSIIKSDPDLSMYRLALFLADSLREDIQLAQLGGDLGIDYMDTFNLSQPIARYYNAQFPTVLAPTNKAFYNAGFHTREDLIALATRYYYGFDPITYNFFYFSSLDTVVKHHILYNQDLASTPNTTQVPTVVLYNDMLQPDVNNGFLNLGTGFYCTFSGGYYDFRPKTPLVFSNQNGSAYVKWSNNPAEPAIPVLHDIYTQKPVNSAIGTNGVLNKVDKLFYPPVN